MAPVQPMPPHWAYSAAPELLEVLDVVVVEPVEVDPTVVEVAVEVGTTIVVELPAAPAYKGGPGMMYVVSVWASWL